MKNDSLEIIERPSLVKFSILLGIFLYLVRPYFAKYGLFAGAHVAFLVWTFFVLCMPVARGKILIGSPYYLKFGSRLKHPEIFVWGVALLGNMLTLATSNTVYFRSTITHLLYLIMRTKPLWTVIIICAIATFYDSVFCNYVKTVTPFQNKIVCRFLILTSFVVTFFLTFDLLVLLVNAHGP